MKVDDNTLLARIEYLSQVGGEIGFREGTRSDLAREVYAGTLSLVSGLYGPESQMAATIRDANARIAKYNWGQELRDGATIEEMRGILRAVRAEVEGGLLTSIRNQAKGEILADFVLLAKEALDHGSKDVAAVLSTAALEDTLKRFAEAQGLDCDDKDMSDVISALKGASLVQGPQGKVLQSFVTVRNKALHAEWDRIDAAEVHSVIGFLQTFLQQRFS